MKKEKTEDQKIAAEFKSRYPIGSLLYLCWNGYEAHGPIEHRVVRIARRWSDQTHCMLQAVTVELFNPASKQVQRNMFHRVEKSCTRGYNWHHDLETLQPTKAKAVAAHVARIKKDAKDERAAFAKRKKESAEKLSLIAKFK